MIFNVLYAQEATQAASETASQASPMSSFVVMGIIFAIFYFLIIRPSQKKAKQEQALINELKKGDEVYTRSGLVGKVHGLTSTIVTLEVSEGVHIKVIRNQVSGRYSDLTSPPQKK